MRKNKLFSFAYKFQDGLLTTQDAVACESVSREREVFNLFAQIFQYLYYSCDGLLVLKPFVISNFVNYFLKTSTYVPNYIAM